MRYRDIRVVGGYYRSPEAKEYLTALKPGDILDLEREPENLYDPNAIKVLSPQGLHLGYINREDAAYIGPDIDEGLIYTARVNRVDSYKDNLYPFVNIDEPDAV